MRTRHPTHGYDHSHGAAQKFAQQTIKNPVKGGIKPKMKHNNTVAKGAKVNRPTSNAEQASSTGRMYE